MRFFALFVVVLLAAPGAALLVAGPAPPADPVARTVPALLAAAASGSAVVATETGPLHLTLEPVALFADDFRAEAMGADGAVAVEVGGIRAFRGAIVGEPDSWVRLTFNGDRFVAGILAGTPVLAVSSADGAIVLEPWRAEDAPFGEDGIAPPVPHADEARPLGAASPLPPALRPTRFYVVADYTFWSGTRLYNLPGSPGWAWVAAHQMNLVSGIFQGQVGTSFVIGEMRVFDDIQTDPFLPVPADHRLLDAFRHNFENVEPTAGRPRDLAILMSGKGGEWLGFGYIGAVGTPHGYSWANAVSLAPRATVTVAHEIGHNFNGVHAHAEFENLLDTGRDFGRTIMFSTICNCIDFSRGVLPWYNNEDRLRAHAARALG